MNVLKNMEAVFAVTLGLACAVTYMADAIPEAKATSPVAIAVGNTSSVPVIVVSAKRMTAAEKQQSLVEESLAARADAASSI